MKDKAQNFIAFIYASLEKSKIPKWKRHLLSCVQLFATPWPIGCQAPLSIEFSRQEYWSGLPFPSLRGSSKRRDQTWVSCIASRFFTIWVIWAQNLKKKKKRVKYSIDHFVYWLMSFPGGSDSKESACNAGDLSSIPRSGRCPGEGNSYPLQYSCLENPMDRRPWQATVHGITKSRTWLSDFTSYWLILNWYFE